MLVADLANAFQVALRRNQDAARAGDRLHDHGRDGRSVVQLHDPLQLVGHLTAPLRLTAAPGLALEVLRVAQVVDAGQKRPEQLAVRRYTAHRNAAETDAVVALLAPDQPHPLPFPAHPVPGDRDLQRRIDRFGTRVHEEDAGQPLGRDLRQPVGQFEGARIAHLKSRVVVQLRRLLLDRRHDVRMAVPRVAAPQPRHAVEQLPPVVRRVIHALGTDHEAGVALELPVRRKRHPVRLEIRQLRHVILARIHGRYPTSVQRPRPPRITLTDLP